MLNPSRVKVYINAYNVRMLKGEKLKDIDNDYISLGRLTKDDVEFIHKQLGAYQLM